MAANLEIKALVPISSSTRGRFDTIPQGRQIARVPIVNRSLVPRLEQKPPIESPVYKPLITSPVRRYQDNSYAGGIPWADIPQTPSQHEKQLDEVRLRDLQNINTFQRLSKKGTLVRLNLQDTHMQDHEPVALSVRQENDQRQIRESTLPDLPAASIKSRSAFADREKLVLVVPVTQEGREKVSSLQPQKNIIGFPLMTQEIQTTHGLPVDAHVFAAAA